MLLAAGLGTRLRPVTNHLAKPAVPFLGVPLIFWSLELIKELGPDRVIANLHHLPETIRALAPTFEKSGPPLRFTHEAAAPLGSGGALWFAKKELEDSETILVANADEVILPVQAQTLSRMREVHEKAGALATFLTMRHPEAGSHFGGVWADDALQVKGFGRDAKLFPDATQALHYVGVLLVNRRIFQFLPEGESNLLYDAIQTAIRQGERVQAYCADLRWYETGNPKDFLTATQDVLSLVSPRQPQTPVTDLAGKILGQYAVPGTRLWESASGARLLISKLAAGSMSEGKICEALEKEKAFAVIGPNALIQSPVLNSVVLPNARVAEEARDTIVLPGT